MIDESTLNQNTLAYRYNHKLILDELDSIKPVNILEVDKYNLLTHKIKTKYPHVSISHCHGDFDENIYVIGNFDGEILAIPGSHFDTVVFTSVIEHLYNPLFALEEIKKYIKPDGILLLAMPKGTIMSVQYYWHFHEMTKNQLFMLMDRAGFMCVSYKEFPRYWGKPKRWGIRPILRRLIDKYIISQWVIK